MGIRTTITLDEDVLERLKARSSRTGKPMEETVNNLLREGLERTEHPAHPQQIKLRPGRPVGFKPGLNIDKTSYLLEVDEDPYPK
jgi:plasmid stability protein